MRRARLPAAIGGLVVALTSYASSVAGSAQDTLQTIEVQPGQNVRDLSRRYLGSLELWRDLLVRATTHRDEALRDGQAGRRKDARDRANGALRLPTEARDLTRSRREGEGAKFANYEVQPVKLSSGTAEVTLGWNQGIVVSSEEGPAEPKDLLPPPAPTGSVDDSVHYRETVLLRWAAVEGAVEYTVEVDRDSRFGSPVLSAPGLPTAA